MEFAAENEKNTDYFVANEPPPCRGGWYRNRCNGRGARSACNREVLAARRNIGPQARYCRTGRTCKMERSSEVEDAAREPQVVHSAVQYGAPKGLDERLIANVFNAQIEANKVVQYSLLGDWHRNGRAPAHRPVNLAAIRLELDRLQTDLIEELADLRPL
jgi:chorismate mutase-like protein